MTGVNRPEKVQAVLDLLLVIDGQPWPDPASLLGASAQEISAAEQLYAAGLEASLDRRRRRVKVLAFLAEHAPGAPTCDAAIARLDEEQLAALVAIAEDDDDAR